MLFRSHQWHGRNLVFRWRTEHAFEPVVGLAVLVEVRALNPGDLLVGLEELQNGRGLVVPLLLGRLVDRSANGGDLGMVGRNDELGAVSGLAVTDDTLSRRWPCRARWKRKTFG